MHWNTIPGGARSIFLMYSCISCTTPVQDAQMADQSCPRCVVYGVFCIKIKSALLWTTWNCLIIIKLLTSVVSNGSINFIQFIQLIQNSSSKYWPYAVSYLHNSFFMYKINHYDSRFPFIFSVETTIKQCYKWHIVTIYKVYASLIFKW